MPQDDIERADELRFALWGPVDDGARRVARLIAEEEAQAATARRVEGHRALRDALRGVQGAATPPRLKSWLRRTVAERRPAPAPAELDVTWIAAPAVYEAAGMRGGAHRRHIACAFFNWDLRAQVQVHDGESECSVMGTLRSNHTQIPLPGFAVSLYVDLALRESARTGNDGTFLFSKRPGSVFGIRVGEAPSSMHLTLIDLTAEVDSPGPAR